MKYLFFTWFLASSLILSAQSLVVSPSPASGTGLPTDLFIKVESFVTNTTNAAINVRWERYNVQIPTGWDNAVCDKSGCYSSSVDSEMFTIDPGEMAIMSIWFVPNNIPGPGSVELRIYNEADSANSVITNTYSVLAEATPTEDLLSTSFKVFPNPATNFIQLPKNSKIGYVRLYDILGRLIINQKITNRNNYLDVSKQNTGSYLVQFLDKDLKILHTTRIIKHM